MRDHYPKPPQPELLSDHEIFQKVFELQRDLDSTEYDTIPDAYRFARYRLYELEREAHEAGILEQPVILTGFNIAMPRIELNKITGMESVNPVFVTASEEPNAEHEPIRGLFYGFHPAVVRADATDDFGSNEWNPEEGAVEYADTLDDSDETDEEEAPESYRVVVHYRIGISSNLVLGNFIGAMCAEGNISCTTLEFQADRRDSDCKAALSALVEATDDIETAVVSNQINELLTIVGNGADVNIYGQHRLKQVGELLRKLEEKKGVDQKYRDAVIDLVTAHLGIYPGAEFSINATSGYAKGEESALFVDEQIQGEQAVRGLAFAPHYEVYTTRAIIDPTVESLSVVVDITVDGEQDIPCYIPFEKIRSFIPADKS